MLHLVGFFFMNCTMMHGSTNIKFKIYLITPNPKNSDKVERAWCVTFFTHLTISVCPIEIKFKQNPVKNKGPPTRYQNIWFWKAKVYELIHVKLDICQCLCLLISYLFMMLAAPFQIISIFYWQAHSLWKYHSRQYTI